MNAAVFIQQSKQISIERGHPWIFPKAIAKTRGQLVTGQLVEVCSENGEHLAIGVYNEHSLYRVRVLLMAWENQDCNNFATLIRYRLAQALQLRKALGLPNENTNAYRLFNSEGDGLSGLTIDCFNDYYVVSSSAYWVEEQRATIIQCLQELVQCKEILWFAQAKSLQQDGWQEIATPPPALATQVCENGISYAIDFSVAQKTGLFIDQRENHQRIAALAEGKRVLDLYTYSGGFALHAAKAGAVQVTAVDSSKPAIAQAKQNAELNKVVIDFIAADARDYLSAASDYDLIILDPPKLIPSKRDLQRAKNYYRFLHRELFKAMKSGALLMTCNCSSAMSTQEFTQLVSTQAIMAGRQPRILGIYGPASCHPMLAAFPEGNYLTAVLLGIG